MEQSGDASPGPTSVGAGRVAAAVPATPSVAVACLTSALAEDEFAVAVVPVSTALSWAAGREPISGTVVRTMAAGIAVRPAGAGGRFFFLTRTLFNEWANYVINPIAVMAAHYKDPSGHKRHDVLYSYIYRSY